MSDAGTLSSAFVAAAGALRQAGMETPELDARLLLCHAAKVTHEGFIARGREKREKISPVITAMHAMPVKISTVATTCA